MSNNIFSENFNSGDFEDEMRRFREPEARKEAMKKHPAGTKNTKTNPARLSDGASAYLGLTILWFFFVTIPLALLFAGLAVVPVTEVIFNTEIGFWTAFFLLMTLRWLIPRPRNNAFIGKGR